MEDNVERSMENCWENILEWTRGVCRCQCNIVSNLNVGAHDHFLQIVFIFSVESEDGGGSAVVQQVKGRDWSLGKVD